MRPLAALVLALSAAVAADEPPLADAERWMARLVEAAHATSYHGEIVHLQGRRHVRTLEIVRRAETDGYRERLLTLDGVPSEVMRDGRTVTCILPEGRESLTGQRVPHNPFPGHDWNIHGDLERLYEFVDLGDERIAGRGCKVIGVKPRDAHRYGYRLCVDHGTGLLLKADIIDEGGEALERVTFTRVALPAAVTMAALAPTLEGETLSWTVTPRDGGLVEEHIWQADGMPDGFAFDGARTRASGVVQQVFSDGIASVSIFVAPAGPGDGLDGVSRMGALSAFGTRVDGHQVTVVGEVPVATVRAIGESLRLGR